MTKQKRAALMDLSITHLQLRPHAVTPHCSETYQDMSACFPNGYARRTMSTCLPGVERQGAFPVRLDSPSARWLAQPCVQWRLKWEQKRADEDCCAWMSQSNTIMVSLKTSLHSRMRQKNGWNNSSEGNNKEWSIVPIQTRVKERKALYEQLGKKSRVIPKNDPNPYEGQLQAIFLPATGLDTHGNICQTAQEVVQRVATSAQTWPTSKTGSIKPTQRAVPHIGSETACWYPDTASFTYAH
ncbi:hypothetical protein Anapl_14703 [Anas platyrhynchos]|uniref:Uncharacterized protein n=1 Tax=Anas platyrhynchos TaxID=8839 RepID=R0LUX6_ANAPL|nr:hypothetical protein Anapl_14703 [Anas platyrhynchos]